MILYRIQNPITGLGPYQTKGFNLSHPHLVDEWQKDCSALRQCHSIGPNHLSPIQEGIQMDSSEKCAFTSIRQMEQWFEGWMELLVNKYGFVVYELDVPDECVRVTPSQAVYYSQCVKSNKQVEVNPVLID